MKDTSEEFYCAGDSAVSERFYCKLAGRTFPNPEYRMQRYPASEYVFEYVISGHGFIDAATDHIVVGPGMFYMYRKGARLEYYADPTDPYEKLWMNLDGDLIGRMLDLFELGEVFISTVNVMNLFLEAHDRLRKLGSKNDADIYAEVYVILFEILTEATKSKFFPEAANRSSLDERIKSFIDANMYTDMTLDTVSEEFGISKMHIIRVFKAEYNITPIQYLLERRISVSKSLLTGTVMPVKEISSLLRYSNAQHFSSSFRKAVGCTPLRYRKTGGNITETDYAFDSFNNEEEEDNTEV